MPATAAGPPIQLGSRFRTIQSQVLTIPFDAGNTRSVELPRSFLYKMIRCRLRGSITSAAATAGPTNEEPLGLIKRIDLIADGRKTILTLSGQDAYRLSNLFSGKAGELVPAAGGAAATQAISAFFMLHNEAARMLTPIMSYFDPRPYEKIELRVQWGTISDMFSTPSTASVNAETGIEFQVVQSAEGAEQIGYNRLYFFDEFQFGAGQVTNFTINVPRAGLLAGILVRSTQTNAAAGLPSPTNLFFQDSALASSNLSGLISLKSDNNFLHADNINPTVLQSANVEDYALDVIAAGSNIGFGVPGYYYLDLTEDGLVTSLLNTFDLNVLQLIVSSRPAGTAFQTSTMRVTYVFYEPITAA